MTTLLKLVSLLVSIVTLDDWETANGHNHVQKHLRMLTPFGILLLAIARRKGSSTSLHITWGLTLPLLKLSTGFKITVGRSSGNSSRLDHSH